MEPEALGLVDTIPCGYLSFTDDGCLTRVNRTLADRLGATPAALVGKHVETLLPMAGRLFYQTHFFPLVRMHGRAQEVFLLFRAAGGEEIGMLCNAVRGPRDGVDHTDCVLMEVRERRKYEDALLAARRVAEDASERLQEQAVELEMQHEQLQQAATELEVQSEALQSLNDALVERTTDLERAQFAAESANRAKSEFLASMSHELRTPLNAIGGYVELMADGIYGTITEPQRDALERVTRAQRHLLGLINDVLNLARVEAGRIEYRIEPVRLAGVIDELSAMIEPQVAAKAQRFSVLGIPPRLAVCADHEKLVQILLNLLSNAVKFTPPDGTIALSASPRDGHVDIVVADSGRGVPADKLESIFEPFVQVRAEASKPNEGTGLGLAISRNLARGMDGELSVTSEVDVGSTFTLTLPALPDHG